MAEAYIVDAVRAPIGRKKGSFAAIHPADLAAHPLRALMARTGIDPNAVDDVIWGCCDTIGPQAGDIGRTAWLVAGLPEHVPGVTIDRQCGSSQQAVHFAAQGVMSGTQDLVVAGGSLGGVRDGRGQISIHRHNTPHPLAQAGVSTSPAAVDDAFASAGEVQPSDDLEQAGGTHAASDAHRHHDALGTAALALDQRMADEP